MNLSPIGQSLFLDWLNNCLFDVNHYETMCVMMHARNQLIIDNQIQLDKFCNIDFGYPISIIKSHSCGMSERVIMCLDRAGRVNVGTIGHIDAARLSHELNRMDLLFRSPNEIHEYVIAPMEERRYMAVFDDLQREPKPGGEEWRERNRRGRTGVAKSRRAAKKRT